MVKIPGFDELKKMGSDLVEATKSINIKEVVDHFKGGAQPTGDAKTKQLFQSIRASLQELLKTQPAQPGQETLIKQLEQQVAELEKIMESPSAAAVKPEDKK